MKAVSSNGGRMRPCVSWLQYRSCVSGGVTKPAKSQTSQRHAFPQFLERVPTVCTLNISWCSISLCAERQGSSRSRSLRSISLVPVAKSQGRRVKGGGTGSRHALYFLSCDRSHHLTLGYGGGAVAAVCMLKNSNCACCAEVICMA